MKPTGQHPHKRLTAVHVKNLTVPGRYGDGNGLYLIVDPSGAKRWVLRVMVDGKRKDIGLGGLKVVSLADARAAALAMHSEIRSGKDPVAERRSARRTIPTFDEAATALHKDLLPTWKNDKHGQQWINTVKTYAIGTPEILAVLQPIWLIKPETASRVKQRLHAIFDWAKASGFCTGENPVDGVVRGLPKQNSPDEHHGALPYDQVGAFVQRLRDGPNGVNAKLGFELLILTATRTSEVLEAKWSEFDLKAATWTIPAERMKANKEHRVPLTQRCLDILAEAAKLKRNDDYVFPGRDPGKPLSNMAFLQIVKRMKLDITPHGFRSAFRDWAAETTNYPNDVCEQALAHTVKNKVEAAYKRTDHFERRVALMNDWARYATGTPPIPLPVAPPSVADLASA